MRKEIETIGDLHDRDVLIEAIANDLGQLIRRGKTIYYAFIDGTYREHENCYVLAGRVLDATEGR